MSREHIADASDPADWAAAHGEPLACEGGPGAISQQVFEGLTIDTQLETKERDSDTRVDGKPAVLPGEHVGGGSGVEQAIESEPADYPATDPLGECGQMDVSDRAGRQERRRGIAARPEDAVGHLRPGGARGG